MSLPIDCLWSVISLAERCNVDLERAFLDTMIDVEARIADRRDSRAEFD